MSTETLAVPAATEHGAAERIAGGSTQPGKGWKYDAANKGVYLDVSTKSAGFHDTPVYVVSIGGTERQWETTGGCCVYHPTKESFRVWLRYTTGPITAKEPEACGWYVSWIAFGK
jgi:hypothetical protein